MITTSTPLLKPRQVAELLGIGLSSVYRLAERGFAPQAKNPDLIEVDEATVRNEQPDPLLRPLRREIQATEQVLEDADRELGIARANVASATAEIKRQRREFYLPRYKEAIRARDGAIERLVMGEETDVRRVWAEAYQDGIELPLYFVDWLQPWSNQYMEAPWEYFRRYLKRDGYLD